MLEIEQIVDKKGEPRHYTVNGQRFPSVTTVLRILDKPALVPWAWSLAVEGAAEINSRKGVIPVTPAYMRQALVDNEWGWWQKRDAGGLRGSQLHKAIEDLIEHGKIPSFSEYAEENQGYLRALARWWVECKPTIIATELKVGSLEHGFAGRLDLIEDDGGEHLILDIKSGGQLKEPIDDSLARFPYEEHHLQSQGYQIGYEETYEEPIHGGKIINLADNGDYRVTPALGGRDQFLAVLNAYNHVAELRKEISKWKADLKAK